MRENSPGHRKRRGDNDYVIVDAGVGPLPEPARSVFDRWICNPGAESLRREKLRKPSTHLAVAANDEHPPPIALPLGNNAIPFLAGKR